MTRSTFCHLNTHTSMQTNQACYLNGTTYDILSDQIRSISFSFLSVQMWKPGESKPVNPSSGPTKNATLVSKTTLSGSTMGMRFMQRTKEQHTKAVKIIVVEKDVRQNATPSDMYGSQSDLIGRRSFGNFNKSVSDNYTQAKNTYEGNVSSLQKEQHISDEELLQRYKDHIHGCGNGLNEVNRESAAPIGNLAKRKRKATR